ncbi:MAG: carbohydrate-binding protein [Chitinivibrionales bacterium]|nr:carbohydrate-binding protein [Chitinivibrionales bacterium]
MNSKVLKFSNYLTARIMPILLTAILIPGCFQKIQIKPLPGYGVQESASTKTSGTQKLVYRFFDEAYVSGGYAYWYPDQSKVFIPEESGKNGEVSLQFDLIADEYSGGSVCLYNLLYDMSPYYADGALQFWVKGAQGGELAWVALVDDENSDGKKTVVRVPLNEYGSITDEWTRVTIPLVKFGGRGVFWDPKKSIEIPERFDWDKVAEFRIEIKKGENKKFRIWVDDIFVLRDVVESSPAPLDQEYWDEREETITPPPAAEKPNVTPVHTIFIDALPAGAFAYVYGGKTAHNVHPTTSDENKGVLVMYQDNEDYSGVTYALGKGKNINLTKERTTHAGLAFFAKASPKVTKAYVGILDDESDGKKVQTKVALSDFGTLDTTWKYFMIPIKQFMAQGSYWDATNQAEIGADVDWSAINEFRFSINRYENRVDDGEPAVIYIDDMQIIEDIPGYVDPDEYWAAFESDEPDVLLHDFESEEGRKWESASGPKSEISCSFIEPENKEKYGSKAMEISFKLGDYCDAYYDYLTGDSSSVKNDWSQHWGLRFSFYATKPYQSITVQIQDGGNEVFVSNVGGRSGWSEVLVPFKDFNKFPYYQPEDAEQNGRLDLIGMHRLDFKPSGEGTVGSFGIDNVKLTNTREIQQPKAPEKIALTISGDFDSTVTGNINPGLFGINAALWDGDLLKPATAKHVKAVDHNVVRYPGGLRADEDHWQEVLQRKDWMVDTDEFMEFCATTDNEAMITVNFGRGTPEEAAAWVKHINVDSKDKVKLWEIGNELYGDWHANHCTAEEYGKRAAEFIKAMKAVDPSILVGVVWVLEGEWNKVVFEYTKDLADAVIVHHYPQHAGEENDFALLVAPQSLDDIIPSVRRQVNEYGNAEKEYEIWLTEWNSVDFKPGPQTLTIVNALFVADYLGVLAKHNIEQASYWDIHNDITPEGGDYGYLSRTGAPDGDNVPRPSYWAFKLASNALRGKLVSCTSDNDNVTCYLTEHDGGTTVMIVNKMPETTAEISLNIPGFTGAGSMNQLTKEKVDKGIVQQSIEIAKNQTLRLPPYSLTSITLK